MGYLEVMLDLETLSTAPDAAVVQVGLVPFLLDGCGPAAPGLHVDVNPQSCIDAGFRVGWDTLHWWMMQAEDARQALPAPGTGRVIGAAVADVMTYLRDLRDLFPDHELRVWSHGAAFDVPILGSAFRKFGLAEPWDHRHVMDTRTMKMMCPPAEKPEPTVSHRALDDAMSQALWVQNMWRALADQK